MNIRRMAALLAVSVLVAACSSSSATPVPAAATPVPAAATPVPAAATPAPFTAANLNVAVVVITLANPYWVAVKSGADAEAARLGAKDTVQAATTETDIEQQTTILTTMAGQSQYNCFIVAPATATNLVTPLAPVSKAGIPIINIDSALDPASLASANVKLTSFIASDNEAAGKLVGAKMSALLGGSGDIAIIGGIAADTTSDARVKGFKEGATGLNVIQEVAADWDRVKALNTADTIMKAHPSIKGFFAANDDMGLGIQQAVDTAGKTGQVLVMGMDGNADAFTSILAGHYSATVAQSPYAMGVMGVDACLAANEGKTVPAQVVSPTFLITKDNAAAAQAKYPLPPDAYNNPFAALIGS
jgi:ABC-type sugar transport system substrate-binding protein